MSVSDKPSDARWVPYYTPTVPMNPPTLTPTDRTWFAKWGQP